MLFVMTPHQSDAGFSDFWQAYPCHKAKRNAEKAWRQVNGARHREAILTAIAAQKAERQQPGWHPQWPYPASWLRAARWEDEVALSARLTLGDDTLWSALLDKLEANGTINRYNRMTWLEPCQVTETPDRLVVDVAETALAWVERHYMAPLTEALAELRPGCRMVLAHASAETA